MDQRYTYLLVNVGCIIMPLLFSFYPKLNFYKQWKRFILPCLLTAAFFLIWDGIFTHLGVWGFNDAYVIGIYWFKMPVEEYLFFICIPFACVFTYYTFKVLFVLRGLQSFVRWFYIVLALVLFFVAFTHIAKLYTSVTFILLACCLLYFTYKNYSFLPVFFICFLFILIPFLLSNGILTGSFFNRVVVMYNDNENLHIRLLTIPVEDIFYAMLLLLLNVYGFERRYLKDPQ
ncbi:MAG: lycopene cyclase domain-containing protein [Bacteroidetes bacterium]|nr:lycopene cyclase domain-containing protein [Bacteroidota bacterium]